MAGRATGQPIGKEQKMSSLTNMPWYKMPKLPPRQQNALLGQDVYMAHRRLYRHLNWEQYKFCFPARGRVLNQLMLAVTTPD